MRIIKVKIKIECQKSIFIFIFNPANYATFKSKWKRALYFIYLRNGQLNTDHNSNENARKYFYISRSRCIVLGQNSNGNEMWTPWLYIISNSSFIYLFIFFTKKKNVICLYCISENSNFSPKIWPFILTFWLKFFSYKFTAIISSCHLKPLPPFPLL